MRNYQGCEGISELNEGLALMKLALMRIDAKRSLFAVAAVAALLLVAGCASQGSSKTSDVPSPEPSSEPVAASETVTPGIPEGWEDQIDQNRLGEQILAGWVEDGKKFAVVTWGSSTCVPVADTIQVTGADSLELVFAPSPNKVCTMDMAPSTHTLELPAGVTERPIALTVTMSEFDRSESLELK